MSVFRLVILNRTARNYSSTFHSFSNSSQLFYTLNNCRIRYFVSCLNFHNYNYDFKCNQITNNNSKTYFKCYSQATQAESSYSQQNADLSTEPKIIYNSVIKSRGFVAEKRRQLRINKKLQRNIENKEIDCLALKYFKDEISVNTVNEESNSLETENANTKLNLPYSIHKPSLINEINSKEDSDNISSEINSRPTSNYNDNTNKLHNSSSAKESVDTLINDNTLTNIQKNWMFDYEHFSEKQDLNRLENEPEDFTWKLNYGTSDPKKPVSQVPCGGCGALLHCQDPAIPGYLPKELFAELKVVQLRGIICQRCHFLKEYNTALAINVNPKEYPKILSKIKDEKALVILMVDMTDFPCSIWPGILDVVGSKRPLFVVGNKIDLLQGDSKNWLHRAKIALKEALPVNANVKHLCLISAKTGFGIEELINKLFNVWEYRGDVYLVGCTNVGKSTLFNALLQSDYCKIKAVDLVQRATTSPWPGTTLNLLKFPIMRPEGWKLFYRTKRLQAKKSEVEQENKLLQIQESVMKGRKEPMQLIGHVGRTFKEEYMTLKSVNRPDPFSIPNKEQLNKPREGSGLDPDDEEYSKGHWLYDTPGTVQPDQIIDLLTIDELMITLPKQMIIPRSFQIQPNQTLFIGGLGRLDFLKGDTNIKITVCAANKLPITVCPTEEAEKVYNHYIGTKVLGVPFGDETRMKAWPGLQPGQEFILRGISHTESCADVVLSSAGWVAVTPGPQTICKFLAWTPQARGIHIRIPPVLPYTVMLHGNKISSTIAYSTIK